MLLLLAMLASVGATENLQLVFARARAGDTITIDPGIYSGTQNCSAVLSVPNVSVVGFGATWVCPKHLSILADGCTIRGMTFMNGTSGCVSVAGTGNSFLDATFVNCITPTNGGALNIQGKTTLLNNVTAVGSNALGNGGAVYAIGAVTVSSSTFSNNSAGGAGGALWMRAGVSSITGRSSMRYNKAGTNGGAVFMQDTWLRLGDDLVCEANTAANLGGCVSTTLANLSISGRAQFKGNVALQGGGVSNGGTGFYLVVENQVVFTQNSAQTGGAISARNILMRGSVLVENNSGITGAGVSNLVRGVSTITGQCIFRNNRGYSMVQLGLVAKSMGAAVYVSTLTSMYIGGSVLFDSNSADVGGAAVAITGASFRVDEDVVFRNNTATQGGAMYMTGGGSLTAPTFTTLTVTGRARIYGNRAEEGAGIYAVLTTTTIDGDVQVLENNASSTGGGVYFLQSKGTVTGRVQIRNNSALARGGGIMASSALWNGLLVLTTTSNISGNVVLSGNRAVGQGLDGDGGALASENSNLVLEGSVLIENNTAQFTGGGLVSVNAGGALIRGGVVIRGNAAQTGGGILALNAQVLVSCCVRFSNNSARMDGGAMAIQGTSVVSVVKTLVDCNLAARNGGGVFAVDGSAVQLTGGLVSGNRALSGGGLYAGGSAIINATAVVSNNWAQSGGGAAIVDSSSLWLSGSHMVNNSAASDGGGVYSLATLTMDGSSSIRAGSATRGGGVFCNGATSTLSGRIEGNQATSNGGGVFMFGAVTLGGMVRGNAAVGLGGGIFASGADARLGLVHDGSVLVENNTATSGGGLYIEEAASMTVSSEGCTCSGRGNGKCDVACLTRGCNWDDGECAAQLSAPAGQCNLDTCPLRALQDGSLSGGCYDSCLTASCDWSRLLCTPQRAQLATCPLFDLATLVSEKGYFAITAGGARRCATSECAMSPDGNPGATLGGAVSAWALDTSKAWLYVLNTTELEAISTTATLEMWVRGWVPGSPIVSSPNVDVVMQASGTLALRLPNCTELWTFAAPVGWFHLAVVIGNTSIGVFVNGLAASHSGAVCPEAALLTGSVKDQIGFVLYSKSLVQQSGLAVGRYLNGSGGGGVLLDGLRIWDRALMPAELMSGKCDQAVVCYEYGNTSVALDHGKGEATPGFVVAGLQCTLGDEGGQGWCVGPRPDLPSTGLAYDGASMAALGRKVAPMDFVAKQALFPGCAEAPIHFRANRASYGGAIYQAGCNSGLDGHGVCFLSGMSLDSGAMIVTFEGNYAQVGGGAVFTDCDTLMPTCTQMATHLMGVPGSQGRHYFRGNAAGGYGPDVATAASQLVIPGLDTSGSRVPVPYIRLPFNVTGRQYVPGQNPVDLGLVLLDGLGSVVNGGAYVLTMLLCAQSDRCDVQSALRAPAFFALEGNMARTTGVTLVCPGLDATTVFAHFYVAGTTSPFLQRTVAMQCLPCQSGQQRSHDPNMWWCASCLATQYIVDPNRDVCHKCPQGATCDGSGLVGLDGSSWVVVNNLYRLTACPAGYIVIRDDSSDCLSTTNINCKTGPELDHCFRCPGSPAPGRFSNQPAFYPGPLVSQTEAAVSSTQCLPCPLGASCELGGNSVVPLSGYWTPTSSRRAETTPVMYRCLPDLCMGDNQCQEGHTGFVCGVCQDNFTHSGNQCILCGSEESLQAGRISGVVLLVLAFLVVWFFISIRPFMDLANPPPPKDDAAEAGWIQDVAAKLKEFQLPVMMGILKILLTFYQVTSCFWTAFDVPWPRSLGNFFRGSTVTKVNIAYFVSLPTTLTPGAG